MTLTKQQLEIVNYNQLGTLIVKGTAGSGKSLVGLHRINYLFSKNNTSLFSQDTECRVLVITFNKVMFYHLRELFYEIMSNDISKNINGDVCFINIDKIMYDEAQENVKKAGYNLTWYTDKFLISNLNSEKKKYPDEFVLDEIDWIRKNFISTKEEYLNIVRLGRGKRKLNSRDREYIWNILKNYRHKMLQLGNIDYLDGVILTLLKGDLYKYGKYNHIIVDEAQDLNKLKLSFIVKMNQNNQEKLEHSLLLLYDSSQNVYDDSWLGYGRSFSSIGIEARGKTKKLEVSYRTTRQIHQAANNLISFYKETNVDKEMELTPLFTGSEEGIKPFIFDFKNNKNLQYEVFFKIIKKLTRTAYRYKDIMIVAFTNTSLTDIEKYLKDKDIPVYILDGSRVEANVVNITDDKIKILTINNAKGLESKVVFVADTNLLSHNFKNEEKDENEIHIRGAKKLYTAMTRAQELLFISKDDEYLPKIDSKYLTEVKNFGSLEINSYLTSDLEQNSFLIESNESKRFNNIIAEYNKEKKEQEIARIDADTKIKNELQNTVTLSKKDSLEKLPLDLSSHIVELFKEAETLYELFKKKLISSSIVYAAYSKILETMFRDFIDKLDQGYDSKTTFGSLIGHARRFKYLSPLCYELDNLRVITNRNDATHYLLKDSNQVNVLRQYLIDREGISKLHLAIEKQIKVELHIPEENKIVKKGTLYGEYKVVKINQKEYYSYLFNDDELAVCKSRIKSGDYKLSGYYTNSRGLKVFIIETCSLIRN